MLSRRGIRNHLIVSLLMLTQSILFAAMAVGKEVLAMESLSISSTAFKHGEAIPARYSCDGSDVTPPAAHRRTTTEHEYAGADHGWSGRPGWYLGTLGCLEYPDRDAGYSRKFTAFRRNTEKNSWKRNNYGGPCPP